MFAKLFVVSSALVAVLAIPAADRYPAGLNPALCPNYPHCDNALLAAHAAQNAGYAGAYSGAYNGAYQSPAATTYTGPGAYGGYTGAYANPAAYAAPGYPAGVNPASCPNYPYCSNYAPAAYHASPLPGFASRLYPDGINPATCPNYPFCH